MNVLLLCAALVSAPNAALSTALAGRHNSLNVLQLRALAEDPVADLTTIANDASAMVYVRARAASLLGFFDDARVQPALTALLAHEEVPVRVNTVRALAKLATRAAPQQSDALTQLIASRFVDADPSVRLQIVGTLATLPSAGALLAKQLRVERDLDVVDALVEGLAR